jgi:hypothetical protein
LVARGDAQLGENLVQVVLDGAGADEHLGRDLGVSLAVHGQPHDLRFLGGELDGRRDRPLGQPLAGRRQLSPGPRGERLGAHRGEHVAGGAQLAARVDPAALAPEPLTVEQLHPGERGDDAGLVKVIDGLEEVPFGIIIVGYERAAEGLKSGRPVGPARGRRRREPVDRQPGQPRLAAAHGRLHQLGQRRRPPPVRVLKERPRGLHGRLVLAQGIAQHRGRVAGDVGLKTPDPRRRRPEGVGRVCQLVPLPGGQEYRRAVAAVGGPDHRGEDILLFDQGRCFGEVAGQDALDGAHLDRRQKVDQSTRAVSLIDELG